MRRAPSLTEHQEQSLVIAWWNRYAPTKGLDPRLLIAIPNAAKRSYKLAARLKREGMRSGTPDLFLALPRGSWPGLWVEMKAVKGRTNENQLEFLQLLRESGYECFLCPGATMAISSIRQYVEGHEPA